jgi:hypothetical protein
MLLSNSGHGGEPASHSTESGARRWAVADAVERERQQAASVAAGLVLARCILPQACLPGLVGRSHAWERPCALGQQFWPLAHDERWWLGDDARLWRW